MKIIDANILIYAADPDDPLHATARPFVEHALSSDETVGLPWVVLLAFVRVTTRRRASPIPLSVEAACEFVSAFLARPNVIALEPGPDHWRILRELLESSGTGGNFTTDAHLAALAIENGAELCSADSDFARFPRLKWTDPTRGN